MCINVFMLILRIEYGKKILFTYKIMKLFLSNTNNLFKVIYK